MRRILKVLAGTCVAACVGMSTVAYAATEAEKLAAIQNGLAHLYATQQADGSWSYWSGYNQAATGAAAFAFMSQQANWGSNAAAYQVAVDKAMAYLLATATATTVSTRNDGVNICPGSASSCTAVYWYGNGETTYTTGLVTSAIAQYGVTKGATTVATTTGPLAGMTWGGIAQGITNMFSAGQSTALNGNRDGGWRYFPGDGDSDGSTTQWAVVSLIYDQTLGAVTPQTVIDHLKVWLVTAQAADGSGCYQPYSGICDHSDTGSLLIGLKFTGANLTNGQVLAALAWLNANWPTTYSGTWWGNFDHPYAMWAVYKGLETNIGLNNNTYITNLYTDCGLSRGSMPASNVCNWWQDYNEWLQQHQNLDGSWSGNGYWFDPLSTGFYINILGATQIPQITAPCLTINAIKGKAITPATMQATGGAGGPYTYSATGLPNGLTMAANGTISGTPTVTGTFPYTVTITDKAGNTGTVLCSIVVNAPITVPCPAITAKQNTPITPVTVVATGGAGGPYTFTATGLPNGLSISPTGTISGTPTVSGNFTYTITATDSLGNRSMLNKLNQTPDRISGFRSMNAPFGGFVDKLAMVVPSGCSISVTPADSGYRCPLSLSYWKTHGANWPVNSLVLGGKTYSKTELLALLNMASGSDASLILADQLIAAKLNLANGSDPAPVAFTITHADGLLSKYSGKLPYSVSPSTTAGKSMTSDAAFLGNYNNGLLTSAARVKSLAMRVSTCRP